MAKTKYEHKKVSAQRMEIMQTANAICSEYARQGLVLTVRQLYYQFVARGIVPNEQKEYDRLADAVKDARMLGIMDWDYIVDRTRNLTSWKSYKGPEEALKELAAKYHRDMWAPQNQRIEVWVEKDAAIGVIEGVCSSNSVPFFSCRGYTSISEMHEAAQRIRWHVENGNQVTILHIGDHDPSGLDMSRDIEDRLRMFISRDWAGLHMGAGSWTRGAIRMSMRDKMHESRLKRDPEADFFEGEPWRVKRIALSYEQVLQYSPPPNPAKQTDARFRSYVEETGLDESWELDALEPRVLQDLVQSEIDLLRDEEKWAEEDLRLETERKTLNGIGNWWDEVSAVVNNKEKQS